MSYSENGGTPFNMNVVPAGGAGYGGDFLGGNGAWWLIILLLFANNGWGGFGGFGGGMMPWMMGAQTNGDVQRGFDQSAVMAGINGINNSLASAEVSRCNAQANILQSMSSLATGLQNCCCENRAGLADLKYTVATENCADRTALNEGLTGLMMANNANTQNLMNTMNAGIQTVMDKICQLELDAKNQQIADLQAQLNEASRRASQADQTAQILASQAQQTAVLEQYLRPTPVPAYVVQNPNCCTQSFGCGCGA